MSWLSAIPFVLSASYHAGAFTINIPYDRYCKFKENSSQIFISFFSNFLLQDVGNTSTSSDEDIYQSLAKSYANRIVETSQYCSSPDDDMERIIHGADWYEIIGGMQDYGYLNYGTIEMTMEISCCKYPNENLLVSYWNINRNAMIELLLQAQRGYI